MVMETVVFFAVFGGFLVLRIVAATLFFYCILPADGRCPNCDAPTLRVQSAGWNRLMPWFRTSWCMECNWDGLLRHGPASAPAAPAASAPAQSTPPRRRSPA